MGTARQATAADGVAVEVDAYATADHPSLQPQQIEENLFVSSAYTEAALEVLQKHHITHILQVGHELLPHHPELFTYASVDLPDRFDADIVTHLPAAFRFISSALQQQGRVLVHCMHGQSRSAAIVVGFLMWRDAKPYATCLAAVKARRPRCQPNGGFEMQLCLLYELGFDLSRWPGWNAETFIIIRQQQLLLLKQQQQQQQQHQQQHADAAQQVQQQPCSCCQAGGDGADKQQLLLQPQQQQQQPQQQQQQQQQQQLHELHQPQPQREQQHLQQPPQHEQQPELQVRIADEVSSMGTSKAVAPSAAAASTGPVCCRIM